MRNTLNLQDRVFSIVHVSYHTFIKYLNHMQDPSAPSQTKSYQEEK